MVVTYWRLVDNYRNEICRLGLHPSSLGVRMPHIVSHLGQSWGRVLPPWPRTRPLKLSPNKRRGKNCRSRTMAFSFERRPTKTPELSPEGFPATYQIDQAAACAFRFLRQPSRPNAPKPVAKSGSAPGSGVEASPSSAEPGCSTAVINPRLK